MDTWGWIFGTLLFLGSLVVLPLLIFILTLIGHNNPRVKLAVLSVERLLPGVPSEEKQAAAIVLIQRWMGLAKILLPVWIIKTWIDWEVQILNIEKPYIWQQLTAVSEGMKTSAPVPVPQGPLSSSKP